MSPKGFPSPPANAVVAVGKNLERLPNSRRKLAELHTVIHGDGAVCNRRVLACDDESDRIGVIFGVVAHGGVPRCSVFVSKGEWSPDSDLVLEGALIEA